ncbi:tRNA1(Val) (adenine(37)-N6)-methyltransferase [Vibrio methylphosphonaticus]|uniref:tRNA1(Val) (adenine(37)-N6)-methyltransferase n=1 Tax=Vibrio methylphosphonaticus TaxID=2946866 RepID=UPI00202A7428|nr:methyltransferase [Vibrio methylphosphonaticus]MCL9775175.1 methyltransferase [Vibrio methylphosphonaticus]
MTSRTGKIKSFAFKQFKIHSGGAGMPVSTDGVMLGAWATFQHTDPILDIGVGTGLLTLMLAQRYPDGVIHAIDIEDSAIEDTNNNVAHSQWQNRIHVFKGDILSHNFEHTFSGIICNPPYFNSGEQATLKQRATARHTSSLDHRDLLSRCYRLLNNDGEASFILPLTEGEHFIKIAQSEGWFIGRRCLVRPTLAKPVNRILFTLRKQQTTTIEEQLVIHSPNGGYSDAFIQLTGDFYLKM